MRGTVIRRKKRWSFVVDVGRDENGKRQRKWRSGFATKKEAQAALSQFIVRLEQGADPFPEQLTYQQFFSRWADHQATQVRPMTLARYLAIARDDILPVIGNTKMERLRPAHIQGVLDRMAERGLSPRTIGQGRAVMSSSFGRAVAWGLIPSNPVQAVRPPKAERPKLEIPTNAQLQALMATSKGTVWEIPLLLACTTGARRSEVMGLRWRDVDTLRGRVHITQGLVKTEGGHRAVMMDPKTQRARREIVLPPFVAARLRTYKQEQNERRLALGPEWQDLDLLCDRGDGAALWPDAMTRAFRRLAAQAGLSPKTRLHDIRHAFATTMLSGDVHPAIASAVLGHASASFTMNTYQHIVDGMTEKAAAVIDAAFALE